MAIDAHAVRPELEHASGAGGPLGDSRSVQPWLYRPGSNQGNTRSTETLGWRGFDEIQCNPETALFEPRPPGQRNELWRHQVRTNRQHTPGASASIAPSKNKPARSAAGRGVVTCRK